MIEYYRYRCAINDGYEDFTLVNRWSDCMVDFWLLLAEIFVGDETEEYEECPYE
jgi:hypothetical protein